MIHVGLNLIPDVGLRDRKIAYGLPESGALLISLRPLETKSGGNAHHEQTRAVLGHPVLPGSQDADVGIIITRPQLVGQRYQQRSTLSGGKVGNVLE